MTPEEYQAMKQRAEQEDGPRDMVPIADPLDFVPFGGLKAGLNLAKAGAKEGAEVAGNVLAKTGALQKLRGLIPYGMGTAKEAEIAGSRDLGKLINPDIAKMQAGGKITPELAQKASGLQSEINDLSKVNQFDAAREAEMKAANDGTETNNLLQFGRNPAMSQDEATKSINNSMQFDKLKKMMGGQ